MSVVSRKQSKLSEKEEKGKYIDQFDKSNNGVFFISMVVIAADISPIDVLSHLPILCEDKGIPYMYVKSRAEVGEACKTKRPTSCVLITVPPKKDSKIKESYDRCLELVQAKNSYVKE